MSDIKQATVDTKAVAAFVGENWDSSIVPAVAEFIRIPNQSPLYDKEIHTNGFQEKACQLIIDWVREQKVPGLTVELVHEAHRTPLIFMEIAGDAANEHTILMYGHMDKQPPMLPWDEGLAPCEPVIRDGKLYGRGGADDGYSAFGSVCAIRALQAQNVPHARIVVMIEGCEESGSVDLMYYVDLLAPRIKHPSLVICLDSGCGNYDQLWLTSSLRGVMGGDLSVQILTEGVHSGMASGIVPSSFRILRQLLDRIEDSKTGRFLLPEAHAVIPDAHVRYAHQVAHTLGDDVHCNFPWVQGSTPVDTDLAELVLHRTWRPTLSITGVDGIPHIGVAGNVLRAKTVVKLSVRMPPTLDPKPLEAALKRTLEENPPYGAKVTFNLDKAGAGWMAPLLAPWLETSGNRASQAYFGGRNMICTGEGGSIPFMGMLGAKFPGTQFIITGVLGPKSNAHGPNEFLHIAMGKGVTCCVANLVADHHANTVGTPAPGAHKDAATITGVLAEGKNCCV